MCRKKWKILNEYGDKLMKIKVVREIFIDSALYCTNYGATDYLSEIRKILIIHSFCRRGRLYEIYPGLINQRISCKFRIDKADIYSFNRNNDSQVNFVLFPIFHFQVQFYDQFAFFKTFAYFIAIISKIFKACQRILRGFMTSKTGEFHFQYLFQLTIICCIHCCLLLYRQ